MRTLLEDLRQRPEGYDQLIIALRHTYINRQDIADRIESKCTYEISTIKGQLTLFMNGG